MGKKPPPLHALIKAIEALMAGKDAIGVNIACGPPDHELDRLKQTGVGERNLRSGDDRKENDGGQIGRSHDRVTMV